MTDTAKKIVIRLPAHEICSVVAFAGIPTVTCTHNASALGNHYLPGAWVEIQMRTRGTPGPSVTPSIESSEQVRQTKS